MPPAPGTPPPTLYSEDRAAGAEVAAAPGAAGAAPLAQEGTDEGRQEKKALRILAQVQELIKSIEAGGIAVPEAQRALELGRSFLKVRNFAKAVQYARKADGLARERRERARAERQALHSTEP